MALVKRAHSITQDRAEVYLLLHHNNQFYSYTTSDFTEWLLPPSEIVSLILWCTFMNWHMTETQMSDAKIASFKTSADDIIWIFWIFQQWEPSTWKKSLISCETLCTPKAKYSHKSPEHLPLHWVAKNPLDTFKAAGTKGFKNFTPTDMHAAQYNRNQVVSDSSDILIKTIRDPVQPQLPGTSCFDCP